MTDHTTLELHNDDNFIFALDVSASMKMTDCPGGLSRFDYSIEKMKQFCHEAASFQSEGICILTFGIQVDKFDHITEDKIDSIIAASKPDQCGTLTNKVIIAAYQEHIDDGHEDTFLFLVTDGEPTKPEAVIEVLNSISANMKGSFRVVFLTVGQINKSLQHYLNDLVNTFKMVDVKALDSVTFLSSVNTSINK